MQRSKASRRILMIAAVMAASAVVLACPLSMMAYAQMIPMMGQDMGMQGSGMMCPMLCGVPPSSPSLDANGSVLGPLPVHLTLNAASKVRPIFHPPTSA